MHINDICIREAQILGLLHPNSGDIDLSEEKNMQRLKTAELLAFFGIHAWKNEVFTGYPDTRNGLSCTLHNL